MTPENHPTSDEMQLAADLDTFLTAQLTGENFSVPPGLSLSKANVTAILISAAKEVQPHPAFAAQLEARLVGANVIDAFKVFQDDKTAASVSEESPIVAIQIAEQHSVDNSRTQNRFRNFFQQATRTMKLTLLPSRQIHRFSLAAMALLAISSVFVISSPSLRSLAQVIFEHFSRASSDRVGTTTIREADKDVQKEFRNTIRHTNTVREMEIERGFDLKEPTTLPGGFVLQGVDSAYANLVILPYENSQTKALILIAQQRLDGEPLFGPIFFAPEAGSTSKGRKTPLMLTWSKKSLISKQEPALQQPGKSPVGASAKIELVQIGNWTGQYVEGGWEPIFNQGSIDRMRWNQNNQARQIQWQEGNMLFQICTPSGVSRNELLAIANSMK
jgi:hypothetical protein